MITQGLRINPFRKGGGGGGGQAEMNDFLHEKLRTSTVRLSTNFPTKGLRSKRRSSPCTFQVVAPLSIRSFPYERPSVTQYRAWPFLAEQYSDCYGL